MPPSLQTCWLWVLHPKCTGKAPVLPPPTPKSVTSGMIQEKLMVQASLCLSQCTGEGVVGRGMMHLGAVM